MMSKLTCVLRYLVIEAILQDSNGEEESPLGYL